MSLAQLLVFLEPLLSVSFCIIISACFGNRSVGILSSFSQYLREDKVLSMYKG